MQPGSRSDLYREFVDFVRVTAEQERKTFNRRLLSVFIWCFLLPAALSVTLLILIKLQLLPHRMRGVLDWIVLIFPIFYSIYFLSAEVLRELPAAFRRGSVVSALHQAVRDGEWRDRVCEGLRRSVRAQPEDWTWIVASFQMDLQRILHRARYLTALAGAVFFLIMQGIDSLSGTEEKVTWIKDPVLGWIDVSGRDLSQFVGLALFLVLLYLSGSQTYHSLRRYLECAELLVVENRGRTLAGSDARSKL